MSQKTLAGTPAVRYPDPLVKRVLPDGSQPYTAYQAALIWTYGSNEFTGDFFSPFVAPPEYLDVNLLLFGADYPTKIGGVQQFPTKVYDEGGSPSLANLTFPLPPSPVTALADYAGAILPTAPVTRYKQIATGLTGTNSVPVSGYPALTTVPSRGLYATERGSADVFATYQLQLDVTLNGAVVDGPAAYKFYGFAGTILRIPVLLWEPNFKQEIADNGYMMTGVTLDGAEAIFDVVGLWGSGSGWIPGPP